MKRLLFGFAIFITLQLNAQNYLISFEGEGASKSVLTVKVENLTTGTSVTLNGSDILNLTFKTGIEPVWDNHSRLKIYPNPMVDNTTLEFFPPVAGDATITIFDMTGKPIATENSYLENFIQGFRLSGLKNGFYLINVAGHGYKFSGKLVSNWKSIGTISIEKVLSNTPAAEWKEVKTGIKGGQATVDMDYSPGEMLRFTGFSGDYQAVVNDIPTSNKIIIFNFTGIPTLTTSDAAATSPTTATSGGNITNDGGAAITARGICWATGPSPTINDNSTSDGTGSGSFTSTITGLQPFTGYYIRAYATNSAGTAYGNDLTFTTWAIVPSLTTASAFAITRTTATSGGNILSNGGATVSASGICWSTSHEPSVTGAHTSDGTANGSFTGSMTGLLPNTLYYIRAYATNSVGTSYGNELSFTTNPAITATLSTAAVTSIHATTAVSGGNITDDGNGNITSRGICWATTPAPTISDNLTSNGNGAGSFTANLTGLLPLTTYYVRAYATNSAGTAYGNELSFTTNPVQPATLTTTAVTSIGPTTALSGGNITDNGEATITARGICWATTPSPTVNDNSTSDGTGTGSFTSNITVLQPFTVYHIRAYAINSAGTAYGNDLTFTTSAIVPSLTTASASAITRTTATSGGNIISDGGATVSGSGICWSTSHNPSVAGTHTSGGTTNGSFTGNMTGLLPNTLYYIRAYATNSVGTSYGNELSFTTNPAITATLSTAAVTSVHPTTAVSGGNITDDGNGYITTRGICWATTPSPAISDNLTSNGSGTGSFTANITGLLPLTTYYVRAYATNSAGTAYGNELSFTTNPVQPATLTTTAVTSIGSKTARSGGNITDNGGATITARGICWATTPSPTISDNLTSNGNGTGSFIANLTGLLPVTTYYVRAYATNSEGTAYGSDIVFTTLAVAPSVTTEAISTITETTAISGGNIDADSGTGVTARGVCWGTSANPTINDFKTTDGTGTGSFTSNLTGLTPNTRYYVRAYATYDISTVYGNEVTFIFLIPEIKTCKWLRDAACFLNLSFDDSQSSHPKIANLLNQYGFKGNFFLHTSELESRSSLIDAYKIILFAGHEIGSHTVNHYDLITLGEQEILYEIDSSVSRINRYFNINCTSFAHPFHSTNTSINNILFSHNLFTRDVSEYNTSVRSRFDLESYTTVNDVTNFIDEQIANNSSCLIGGHGIDGSGYSPSTTEFFIELLRYIESAQNSKNLWVTTMSNGALYESLFNEVKLTSNIDQSNKQIRIQFDCPDKPIYNKFNTLLFSFKIDKSSSWSILNNGIEYVETATSYIYTIDLKQTRELTLQYNITE